MLTCPDFSTYGAVLDWIDENLSTGEFDNDKRRFTEIAITLCRVSQIELDSEQDAALKAAERYWAGTGSEAERHHHLGVISERVNQAHGNAPKFGTGSVLDRLVFSSLNTNTGLSVFAGEYLVELSEALSLPPPQVGEAFSRSVSN